MIQKKSRKRRSAHSSSRHNQNLPSATVRRFGVALVTAAIVAFQTTSCGLQPTASGPRTEQSRGATTSSRFTACPQFFANGIAPMAPGIPQQRELCYEGFTVLHNGSARTPAFVAERLNRQLPLQAREQERTNRFFADARLPQAEHAELSDYKGSGYVRGHTMLDAAIETVASSKSRPVIHSDREAHYRWPGWLSRVRNAKLIRSMSRKGCSPDNAACEDFFGRLKTEMFYPRNLQDITIDQFIQIVDSYIRWYNEKRIKISLGSLSPIEYRASLGITA